MRTDSMLCDVIDRFWKTNNSRRVWIAIILISISSLYFATTLSKFNLPPSDSQSFSEEEASLATDEEDRSIAPTSLDFSHVRRIGNESTSSTADADESTTTPVFATDASTTPTIQTLKGEVPIISRSYGNGAFINVSSSCHFEDGNGNYEIINGTLTWNWINNSSIGKQTGKNCTIVNQLDPLLHNKYNHSKPLALLTIGDSLDRNIITKWIFEGSSAQKLGFQYIPQQKNISALPPELQGLVNTARQGKESSGVCTNNRVSFAFFKIFGMHHGCDNGRAMVAEDDRISNTTAERVEKFLDFEILSKLSNDTNFVVMISSALWDLSKGKNCNNRVGVSEEYAELYREGMLSLHAAIRKLLPNAPIYWKTSPPISVQYSDRMTRFGSGRTKANQEVLNRIMRKTVFDYNLGVVVDWWTQASQRPEEDRGIFPDGRHYQGNPSIAFYNMFLNAVFDHNPELIQRS